MANPEAGRELKAKYWEWCSSRLADQFLRLTPDQIYELAQRASVGSESAAEARGAGAAVGTELSYHELVALVTEALRADAGLPTFDEWTVLYAEAPERFDEELLGLWRDET